MLSADMCCPLLNLILCHCTCIVVCCVSVVRCIFVTVFCCMCGCLCVLAVCSCVGYWCALAVGVYWLFLCVLAMCVCLLLLCAAWPGGQLLFYIMFKAHGGGVAPAVLATNPYSSARGSCNTCMASDDS